MSGWELFTWINAWILAVGSIIVFILFLRQLPRLLNRSQRDSEDDAAD